MHLRLENSFEELIKKALRLQLPFFQCFLFSQTTGDYITCTPELQLLGELLKEQFKALYVHSSYFINLAKTDAYSHPVFKKEILLAQQLGFSHIIAHAGAATALSDKQRSIHAVARSVNKILKKEPTLTLVLENSGHGGKAVGSSLEELYAIRCLLDYPEKVKFCIDTAHAHVFGYDIISPSGQQAFTEQVENFFGKESLALLHLNDTQEECGSQVDKHEVPGLGVLGPEVLKNIINHRLFCDIPLIIEMAPLPELSEGEIVAMVSGWIKS
ncbi:deoxyribonuclease IV [Candidatus Dependentiae bacterium]|nr:deoxyribonuclease IV [Candidatus Dependentiae bacterium]